MTYDTVVTDLFQRFPQFQAAYDANFAYMGEQTPGAYVVFGAIVIPALEEALAAGDLARILQICAFLEDAAEAARRDRALEALLRIEIGEWLAGAANETSLARWLGTETKRICRYVPGLATQRIAMRTAQDKHGVRARFSSWVKRLRGK
jgi:hypothetical protein